MFTQRYFRHEATTQKTILHDLLFVFYMCDKFVYHLTYWTSASHDVFSPSRMNVHWCVSVRSYHDCRGNVGLVTFSALGNRDRSLRWGQSWRFLAAAPTVEETCHDTKGHIWEILRRKKNNKTNQTNQTNQETSIAPKSKVDLQKETLFPKLMNFTWKWKLLRFKLMRQCNGDITISLPILIK